MKSGVVEYEGCHLFQSKSSSLLAAKLVSDKHLIPILLKTHFIFYFFTDVSYYFRSEKERESL